MEGRWEINRRVTYLPPFIKWTVGKFERRDIGGQLPNYHSSNGGNRGETHWAFLLVRVGQIFSRTR